MIVALYNCLSRFSNYMALFSNLLSTAEEKKSLYTVFRSWLFLLIRTQPFFLNFKNNLRQTIEDQTGK